MAEPQQAYLGKSNMPKPTALPSSPPTGHPKSNEKSALVAALKGASDPKKKKKKIKLVALFESDRQGDTLKTVFK